MNGRQKIVPIQKPRFIRQKLDVRQIIPFEKKQPIQQDIQRKTIIKQPEPKIRSIIQPQHSVRRRIEPTLSIIEEEEIREQPVRQRKTRERQPRKTIEPMGFEMPDFIGDMNRQLRRLGFK